MKLKYVGYRMLFFIITSMKLLCTALVMSRELHTMGTSGFVLHTYIHLRFDMRVLQYITDVPNYLLLVVIGRLLL
jgi:hypothetical protein